MLAVAASQLPRSREGEFEASARGSEADINNPHAPGVAGLSLDLITSRRGFDELEADWNALFERAAHDTQLFQTFNWLWHWCNHFATEDGSELAIVTAREAGRLVLVWPLVKERSAGTTKLVWMGEPASQYGDVLIEDGPDRQAILEAAWRHIGLHAGADVVRLRKVRADAAVAPFLNTNASIVTDELAAPALDLTRVASFADYEKRYPSRARRNRKRQRRRLEDLGQVETEFVTGGARARELAEKAMVLKRVWLAHRGLVSPAFADTRLDAFFADVAEAAVRPAGCHVIALKCGSTPVAMEIGVRCKGRSAIHVVVYDLAYEKTAAGALLMEDSIRRAFDDGFHTFDLLAPADAYKVDWADGSVAVRDYALPLSIAGQVYARLYLAILRDLVKKGVGALPSGVRRVVAQGLNAAIARRS
jgi:CelD/BcsL family acetyltransferase involved in cellulose biosynthesis